MKVFEQILVAIALLGFLMKVMLIRGGSELLFLGCTLGALFYWSLSFATFNHIPLSAIFKKTSYANVSAGRILGSIGLGMALCTIIIGIQYRLLLLGGAAEMITIGAASLTVLLLAALLVMVFKKRASDGFYRGVFIRGGLALLIGIFVFFVPARQWIRLYHRDNPQYRDLFIKAHENPTDQAAQDEFETYRLKYQGSK
jgi:hypothetical protein